MPVELHWLRPFMLWLLLLLPLFYWLSRRWRAVDGWQQLLAPHLYRHLTGAQAARRSSAGWATGLLLLAILAAAGPSWQKLPQPAFQLKRATVVVMDMSMSMRATDVKPNRLSHARFKALDFIKAQTEGDMALLAFAGDAYVISPLTPDHNNLALLLPDLSPEIMPSQGSDLGTALALANRILQQAGHTQGDIVLLTDGFVASEYTALIDQIRALPHRLSILAFGTADGAPIALSNGELLKDARGSIVVPRVPLQQLSAMTNRGGVFAQSGYNDQDISALVALPALQHERQLGDSSIKGDQWQDGGVYLVYLLLALVLWRQRQHSVLMLPLLLLWQSPPTLAADWQWADLWQSRQSQAKQAYDAGDYQQAQQKFDNPLWQGNAAYRNGDYQAAVAHYDKDKSAAGQYNLGNSLALSGDLPGALKAYQAAEKLQADLPGLGKNKQLIEQMLQQQQQNQSQSGEQQSGENQSGDQQSGEKQSGEKQSDKQQSGEQQSGNNGQNQQNDSADEQQAEQQQQNQASKQASDQAQNNQTKQQQQAADQSTDHQTTQQQAIKQAWPNATPEESQQLENLLRKVQDDPSLLLKNKMLLEHQQRQQTAVPQGVTQEW